MSDSDAKKIVNAGNLRGIALDHMTVASAESNLRNKTANLSVRGAAARLSSATAQASQAVAQQSSTPSSAVIPAVNQSTGKK